MTIFKAHDGKQSQTIQRGWDDIVAVLDRLDGEKKTVRCAEISLYDHHILIDDEEWVIAHMVSRPGSA